MATESQDDKDVDALIDRVQSALDELKAAQRKDVTDEEPKDLAGAEKKAQRLVKANKS